MRKAVMADIKQEHLGVMYSLMLEFERHRVPRLLRLKERLDNGIAINDVDFDFLRKQINYACITKHLTVNYPELEEFCLQLGHMYKELCDEALKNEIQ